MTIAVFVENRPFFGALLVHAPFLHELRRRHPGARLVLFSPFAGAEMLVQLGLADAVRVYGGGVAAIARALRAEDARVVYSLRPFSLRIDLAIALSGVPERAGYRSWLNESLFTRTIPHDTAIYRPRKYLALLPGVDAERAPLDAWFREQAGNAAIEARPRTAPRAAGAAGPARTLAVLPGGGAGDFKLWGIDHFLAVCDALAACEPDLSFLFVLGRDEAPLRGRIEASPVSARSHCLVDQPVPVLAGAAFGAAAAVGNDCGPGHLFQMCGCPYVCVMANHDGTAAQRIAEWVDAPHRAFAVTSAEAAVIQSIPVSQVEEAVMRALGSCGPRRPGSPGASPAGALLRPATSLD